MKTIHKKAKAHENKTAKDLRGRTTPASVSVWNAKGDVRTDKYLVECKCTDKYFYTLHIKTWEKISKEALKDGMRIPVMCIELNKGRIKLAVLNYDDYFTEVFDQINHLIYVGTYKMSYKITEPLCLVFMYDGSVKHNLIVVKWSDFLHYTKEGAN